MSAGRMDAAAERAGCMRPARFLAPALAGALLFCCGAAAAHFLLNVNIRVFHAVHEPDGLRLLARVPMPYLLADKTGYAGAGGLPQPAPYTYNRMVDGEVMHYFAAADFNQRPRGLGQFLADGLVLQSGGRSLAAEVGEVRVWPAASQPPFARLDEAKRALASPLQSGPVAETAEIFVGDSVVDVELFYRSGGGGKIGAYMLGSTLNPGLPQQEQTANLIIDHGAGRDETLIFRVRGLMREPVEISRSPWKAAWTFARAGVHHILEGKDHVLFVVCLLLGAGSFASLAWRITGFTAGHSATLMLGFFGYAPKAAWFVPLVEVGIAFSIIYVAADAVLRNAKHGAAAITALLGLLHGLGFSFVLREILHVDSPNLWQSLLAFNAGIEAGQLMIAALVWPPLWLLAKRLPHRRNALRWAIALPCMAVAAVWAGDRLVLFAASAGLAG